MVTHAVNDFCVVELSNFYLDIIKDRLYCEEADGTKRRSAQTALFLILDTMTKIMAPILAFTCDEIWQSMTHRSGDDVRNVVLNEMNQPFQEYDLGDLVSWGTMIQLRDGVNAALEAARNEKKIGKSLEAHVSIVTGEEKPPVDLSDLREHFTQQWWADFFIVSGVDFVTDPTLYSQAAGTPLNGVRVVVSQAKGEKCERCWMHSPTVGADADHPTLCARCAQVVRKLPQF